MNLLPEDGPVDLYLLAGALSNQLIELNYLRIPDGRSPFEPPHAAALEEAAQAFHDYAGLDEGFEGPLRRALAWVLNLPDDRLLAVTRRMEMAFPNADAADRRRFLELLWRRAFADWRVEGFDADAFTLKEP
jgi:hypothetical protein